MDIREATRGYEAWLAGQIHLIQADLEVKHRKMAESIFSFLRATFYRWVQLWPEACPDLSTAPSVLSVGDLHVENFGTWRDPEGRLIWGANDFDEAFAMSYANDLVRLAVSANLAIQESHLSLRPEDACDAILDGYVEGLSQDGRPFVLAEHHAKLRDMALSHVRDPVHFWQRLDRLPTLSERIPSGVTEILEHSLPERGLSYRVVHRQAGLGSLGRQRFAVIAEWHGGKIAREAKELTVSACLWARVNTESASILYQNLIRQAVRQPDPFIHLQRHWIVRRLAPDCSRIELASLSQDRDEIKLLHAMGMETANIHLGSKKSVDAVRDDLKRRHPKWLRRAVDEMVKATRYDWEAWRKDQAQVSKRCPKTAES